jgi:hypothetical protein
MSVMWKAKPSFTSRSPGALIANLGSAIDIRPLRGWIQPKFNACKLISLYN